MGGFPITSSYLACFVAVTLLLLLFLLRCCGYVGEHCARSKRVTVSNCTRDPTFLCDWAKYLTCNCLTRIRCIINECASQKPHIIITNHTRSKTQEVVFSFKVIRACLEWGFKTEICKYFQDLLLTKLETERSYTWHLKCYCSNCR